MADSFTQARAEEAPPPPGGNAMLRLVMIAGTGAGALLLMAAGGAAQPGPAALAAGAVVAVGAVCVWRTAREAAARKEAVAAETASPVSPSASLGLVAEHLPDPLLVVAGHEADDFAGRRIVFANAAARDLLRIPREGALLVAALRHPEILEIVDEALFAGMSGEAAYDAGGAQDRFWKARAAPLDSPDGGRLAALILRDETDARRNERMRADFLANASHELRTPLASLTGFIETLRGHAKDDPKARDRFLEIMSAQADRMSRLIADLMSLSRIELNEHIAPAGEVDLAMAAVDVLDALAPQAREAAVRLQGPALPRGEAVVPGDRDQIIQVIQNLVDNAMKYAGKDGAASVEVVGGLTAEAAVAPRQAESSRLSLLTPDHAEGLYAAIRISDTGPGIAREHLPRLTERFYRVEGQKSGERSGTGLGLAIVKHIVNRHRGGLAVESVPGKGATFIVYLPLTPPKGA